MFLQSLCRHEMILFMNLETYKLFKKLFLKSDKFLNCRPYPGFDFNLSFIFIKLNIRPTLIKIVKYKVWLH